MYSTSPIESVLVYIRILIRISIRICIRIRIHIRSISISIILRIRIRFRMCLFVLVRVFISTSTTCVSVSTSTSTTTSSSLFVLLFCRPATVFIISYLVAGRRQIIITPSIRIFVVTFILPRLTRCTSHSQLTDPPHSQRYSTQNSIINYYWYYYSPQNKLTIKTHNYFLMKIGISVDNSEPQILLLLSSKKWYKA